MSESTAERQPVKFKGKDVKLGDRVFTVPPLGLRQVKQQRAKLEKLTLEGDLPSAETMDVVIELAVMAIRRNYPDLATDEIEDLLDLGTLPEVVNAIMGQKSR